MADTKLPALTAASVPALDDVVYLVDVSDTTDDATGSSRHATLQRMLGFILHGICQGRLTTETGVPISTSNRTSQSTLYFTPFNGNKVALYDGTRWAFYTFTERSLSLSGLTSGKNYDVFLYDNSGTLTLELSAAWTDDSTRADALTTQDGIYVKSGSTTRRWIGTIRTTSTTATEDSENNRYVWNLYNQVDRICKGQNTTSHTYTTGALREINAGTGTTRANVVAGLAGIAITAGFFGYMTRASGGSAGGAALGLNSTTASSFFTQLLLGASCVDFRGGTAGTAACVLGHNYVTGVEFGISGTTYAEFFWSFSWLC